MSNNFLEGISVGSVIALDESRRETPSGMVVRLRRVAVGDESDPSLREELARRADDLDLELRQNDFSSSRGGSFDANPAARWLYLEDETQTSMREWASLFPTAKALYPLQRLRDAGRVLPGGVIDDRALMLFTGMSDGIGLRARARIMSELLRSSSASFEDTELVCVSLGCGAAVPNIDATLRVRQESGKSIAWHLYDVDGSALQFAQELADEESIHVDVHHGSFVRAFQEMPLGSVHAVDVLGLWEYLPDRTCIRLLQKSFGLLLPGGSFIASNMLSSRPHLEFNLHGVGWPDIVPRSIDELVAIVEASGVAAEVSVTTSEDGVYAVLEIRKP